MLLALLPAALAMDLDVHLTTPTGASAALTFHDVEGRAPPAFTLDDGGRPLRVTLGVQPSGDTWTVSAEIATVTAGLWRERVHVLLAPRITLETNVVGRVSQGARAAIAGAEPVEGPPRAWTLEVRVHEP